jgi:hypothetical protein
MLVANITRLANAIYSNGYYVTSSPERDPHHDRKLFERPCDGV